MLNRHFLLLVALVCAVTGELDFSVGQRGVVCGQVFSPGQTGFMPPNRTPVTQPIRFDTLSDNSYRGLANQAPIGSPSGNHTAGFGDLSSGAGSYRVATRMSGFDSSRPWEPVSGVDDHRFQNSQNQLDVDLLRLPMHEPLVPPDSMNQANASIETMSLPNAFSAASLSNHTRESESGWARGAFEIALQDQRNLYTRRNILSLGLAIGVVAPLANTSMDGNFRNWYQSEVRGTSSDGVSQVFRGVGDARYAVPFFLITSMVDRHLISGDTDSKFYTWSNRCLRSTVFGAPPLLLTQSLLGGPRPEYGRSNWDPFAASNSASGHAFIGAVPFLVAASMTEKPLAKYSLMAVSTIPGITRVNDDAHYLSQVILGWWISYLAVNSIVETDTQRGNFTVLPLTPMGQPGMSVEMRY